MAVKSKETKVAKHEKGKKAAPVKESSSSSSEEESSEEESSEEEKPKAKATKSKKEAAKKESSSEESSSSEEEKEEAKKSSSESSSESEEEKKEESSSEEESEKKSSAEESSAEESSAEESSAEEEEKPVVEKRKAEETEAAPAKVVAVAEAEGASCTLYVGGLSWGVDESGLQAAFEEAGYTVTSARVQMDRETGRSRGFGFVELDTNASCVAAIEKMNGQEIDGRAIRLDISEGRPKRAEGGGRPASEPSQTLFVKSLPYSANQDSVYEFFSEYSPQSCRVPTDRETGELRGFAYVEFNDIESAKSALEALNGTQMDSRAIFIDYATPRADDGASRGGRGGFGGGRGGSFGGRGGSRGGSRGGFGARGGSRGGFGGGRGRGGAEFRGQRKSFD